jgi:hypothetical protein
MKSYEIIATVFLVLFLILVFSLKSKREKDSSWTGELIKKKDISDEDNENHVYILIFKTNSGKKTKSRVSEEIYSRATIGERYEKIKGEYIPRKLS